MSDYPNYWNRELIEKIEASAQATARRLAEGRGARLETACFESDMVSARLQAAFRPLLERAGQRARRLQELRTQPATEARDRSIALEIREITLVKEAATAISSIVDTATRAALMRTAIAEAAVRETVRHYDEANHYEALFHRLVALLPPAPPANDWPAHLSVRAELPLEKRRLYARISSYDLAVAPVI